MRKFIGLFALAASLIAVPSVASAQKHLQNLGSVDVIHVTRVDANGNGEPSAIRVDKLYNGTGIGYSTGGGVAVTQATSRATAVTANAYSGAITMFTAAGSATPASFTVNNANVSATDTIVVSVKSSTNVYEVFVTAVANGSFQITFFTTGGTGSDAPVINFAIVHAATS